MSLEQQLFTWQGWDGDQQLMTFYDVELVKPIHNFPVGTKFKFANIMFEKSILQLLHSNEKYYEFELKLEIGDEIS